MKHIRRDLFCRSVNTGLMLVDILISMCGIVLRSVYAMVLNTHFVWIALMYSLTYISGVLICLRKAKREVHTVH